MKKILAILLVLCMTLVTLIACAGDGEDDVTTPVPGGDVTTPDGVTTPAGTTLVTSDQTEANLGGAKINVLAWQDAENIEFEFSDTVTDMVSINEAIGKRNENVEARLSCDLVFQYTPGNYNNQQAFLTKAQSFANGDEGDFIDIYASYSMTTALLSTKGLCANLIPLQSEKGLNLSHPWWPETMIQQAMFKDRLYICTGDISTNLLWMMETFYFSKDLATDLNIPEGEFYKLVDEGKWTIDKFYEYCNNVYVDTDTDGKESAGDTFGYVCTWTGYFDDFYVGAGFNMVVKNAEGDIVLADDWGKETQDKFSDTFAEFMNTKNGFNGSTNAFQEGRSLFKNDRAKFAKTARETAETEYGILPAPKFNEAQENYSTCIGFPHTLYAVSASSTQPQNAAVALESMAAQSYTEITPVLFYDALQLRYSPEVDDAITFDILRETLCFDVGRIYTTPLQNLSYSVFRDCASKGSMHFSIQCSSKTDLAKQLIQQVMDDLLAAPQ